MFRGQPVQRTVRRAPRALPAAVLIERDGPLIQDVPYNADPGRVRPVAGAAAALAKLRSRGVRIGVLTTQSGVSRGLLTVAAVDAVNVRVAELLGPVDVWQLCVHGPADGCHCRAPAPGLVLAAARRLGIPPRGCVVIGDSSSDTEAALAAGATALLVRTPATRPDDIATAATVASDLSAAVDWVLGGATAYAMAR
jgi:histidinol-phosphate phosphatase family protein